MRVCEDPPTGGSGNGKKKQGGQHSTAPQGNAAAHNVLLGGIQKRVVALDDLDKRYAILQAFGSPSCYVSRFDFLLINDNDLRRRLVNEVVQTGTDGNGNPIYKPAFKVWTGNAHRHVYRRVVFTSKAAADDDYNLFKGFGVKPKQGPCDKILDHIKHVICGGCDDAYEAMINLMAWQIQNVGEPSRIVVVLHNPNQQAGKGIILEEVMIPVYGPSAFSPSDMDQVFGQFNYAIRGCVFLFLDEVHFAGDMKAANVLKALATTRYKGLNEKNMPIVQCPVAVNLWLASNEDHPVHIEDGDARYWVLRVNETRIGDDVYFADLMDEINHGGREAFAWFLLNKDVSNFVPKRDVPRNNAEREALIQASINPYDARIWLLECATYEQVLGLRTTDINGDITSATWKEKDAHSFGALSGAYAAWQATIKTRVAPRPTHVNSLGEILGKCGFVSGRTNAVRNWTLPSAETCLERLANTQLWKK